MRKFWAYLLGVTTVLIVAARNADNFFKIGDGSNSDKEIIFDTGDGAANKKIKVNTTLDKLQFSNDGTTFKDIGSGGGGSGGVNLLEPVNPSFESSTNDWTASGGTFTATTTASEVGFGDASGKWDSDAINQTLRTADVVVANALEGQGCLARLHYSANSIASGDYVWRVELDDGTALTDDLPLEPTSGWRVSDLGFICPTDDSIRIEIESKVADAPVLLIDNVHLGEDFRKGSTDGSHGWKAWSPTVTGHGVITLDFAEYRRQGDVLEARFRYTAGTPDGTLLTISLPSGINSSSSSDSLLTGGMVTSYAGADQGGIFPVVSATNTNAIYWTHNNGRDGTGALAGNGIAIGGSIVYGTFSTKIAEWAGSGDDTLTLETQGWYVAGYISGANPDLGLANEGSFAVAQNSSLTLTKESGSAAVEIACVGANSEGATCTGTEAVGYAATIPRSGAYKACMGYSHHWEVNDVGDDMHQNFKLSVTENATDTIVLDGQAIQGSKAQIITTGQSYREGNNYYICGVYNFANAGKKTFKLFERTAAPSGTPSANYIVASTNDNRVSFQMYPLTQNFPQAVALTDLVQPSVASCTADKEFCSGTYSPACAASGVGASCSCAGDKLNFIKNGSTVHVSGVCDAASSGAGSAIYSIDVPLGGSFPVGSDGDFGGGLATFQKSASARPCVTEQNADRVKCTVAFSASEGTDKLAVSFSYQIQ